MTEVKFPGQFTTTTTTSSTTVQTNLRFDPSYLLSIPGILKIVEIGTSLAGFIAIRCSQLTTERSKHFSGISMIAFWFSGILLGFYLFHIIEKYYKIPWLKIEFVFCALWSFFYMLVSILTATVHSEYGSVAHAVAAVFGFVAMFAYGLDSYAKYKAIRSGAIAQGSQVVSKQTTSTLPPPPRVAVATVPAAAAGWQDAPLGAPRGSSTDLPLNQWIAPQPPHQTNDPQRPNQTNDTEPRNQTNSPPPPREAY